MFIYAVYCAAVFLFYLLIGGILFQALLTALEDKTGLNSGFTTSNGDYIWEAIFESGRLFETLWHRQIYRLWTKFVYGGRQLFGERKKRIRQMWACCCYFYVYCWFFSTWFNLGYLCARLLPFWSSHITRKTKPILLATPTFSKEGQNPGICNSRPKYEPFSTSSKLNF